MFHKVVAAYNESPEAERALISAIKLTKGWNGELQAITVMVDLPAYTAFAGAADSLSHALRQDREKFYEHLQEKARALALTHGIKLRSHLVEGHGVEAIVDF
jgi:nucleotide-binding universal stress UspA family protein